MGSPKKISKYDAWSKDQGIDYVVAAGKAGVGLQSVRATQSGASPWAVTFSGLGLVDMEDSSYDVIVQGPNGDERCDYSTRTPLGFTITGGANSEALIILVIGRLADQAA